MSKLIKCSSCGSEIATNAKVCPSCGAKNKKPILKKWWFWLLIVIVIVIIASNSGNNIETPSIESGSSAVSTQKVQEEVKGYKNGMYKIGTDMPAGEYVIESKTSTYMAITSDSSGSFDSIVANDNFKNRSIVKVYDGQYLEFNSGRAYPLDEAPAVDTSNGVLDEGMYIAGRDFPAGEYKVVSNGGYAYVEVSSDSTHDLMSIISNDNFEGEKYITVSEGQYLKISGCKLQLN